jgi:hypothetical protein
MEVMKSLQELVRPNTALIVVDPQAVFCSAQSEFVRRQRSTPPGWRKPCPG